MINCLQPSLQICIYGEIITELILEKLCSFKGKEPTVKASLPTAAGTNQTQLRKRNWIKRATK
jgi:hypothetical protein